MTMKEEAEGQEEWGVGALVALKDRRFQETALMNAPEPVGLGVDRDPQLWW